jgi:hypothetical protein
MLELTMYGLVGLAAMLVVAFYFACREESTAVRKNCSLDLANVTVHCDRGQAEASRG